MTNTCLKEDVIQLDKAHIPQHIAFIMDGNRRWAKKHGITAAEGHAAGAENLTRVVKDAASLGIKAMTVYSFSTENWNRSLNEVSELWKLFELYLTSRCDEMVENGVRLDAIGDFSLIPKNVADTLQEVKKATANGKRIDLILAVNYGSRDEIRRSVLKIIDDYESGKISRENITETMFSRYLDTSKWPDPELLIRTSGELRISNFLLWQLSYAEIYVADKLWPDFDKESLEKAIFSYQQRIRRLGE